MTREVGFWNRETLAKTELSLVYLGESIQVSGLKTLYVALRVLWENGYADSFHSKVRDDLLNLEAFDSVLKARVLTKDWKQHYNHDRPHSSLRYQTPVEFGSTDPQSGCAPLRPTETPRGKKANLMVDPTLTSPGT